MSHAADYAILPGVKPFDDESDPMAYLTATPIQVRDSQRQELEAIVRRHTSPQHRGTRATIIVAADQGEGVRATARRLHLARGSGQSWRHRWLAAVATARVAVRVADQPRSGAPATYTPEQLCAVVALACEAPADRALPNRHGTQQELATEAIQHGIVETISPRAVGRFLQGSGPSTTLGARVANPPAR